MTDVPATVERAYRVRLRPTQAQQRQLLRLLGAKRFVWNWALCRKDAAWREDGTKLNGIALSREFTQLRQAPETSWLATLPREPFNQVLRDFDRAWGNFFAGRARRPRRKKRGSVEAIRFTLDQRRAQVDRERGRVQLDGLGKLRFRVTQPLEGRLRSVTVRRNAAGQWFATFTADGVTRPAAAPAAHNAVGIDLGLKYAAVLSTGEMVAAPKHLAAKQARLRRYQRQYVRQRDAAARRQGLDPAKPLPKGTRIETSNRMRKTKRRIGRLHVRVTDARREHQHQLTARVVQQAEVIAIEDLAVKAMSRAAWAGVPSAAGSATPAWARSADSSPTRPRGEAGRWSSSIGSTRAARPVRPAGRSTQDCACGIATGCAAPAAPRTSATETRR